MDDGKLANIMAQAGSTGLFDRLKNLRGLWRDIAASLGATSRDSSDLPLDDADLLRGQIKDCLEAKGGEVSARAHAATMGRSYLDLNPTGRAKFLRILAEEFGPDPVKIDSKIAALGEAAAPEERARAERALRQALESPRVRLLKQFNALPEGVKFLVDMRAELLPLVKAEPVLQPLEGDLKDLLSAWFDIGFLELQRITWRSPALVLEKIMAYEAVHTIKGWTDLKNRLDSDRRLYAFFHPCMPDEPLIFVEVALVRGIAGNIHDLLDEQAPLEDPARADTAIFYSINNAQKGLVGISFGDFLIKRVVNSLSHEFPNLKTFATLSPIPGFRAWLDGKMASDEALLTPNELKSLPGGESEGQGARLRGLLTGRWDDDPSLADALRKPLTRLCARYLGEKRKDGMRALDPVAHFHLSNGARMERLNWLADRSERGLFQSMGLMINYLYKLADIEANHEAYRGHGRTNMSSAIKSLAKE